MARTNLPPRRSSINPQALRSPSTSSTTRAAGAAPSSSSSLSSQQQQQQQQTALRSTSVSSTKSATSRTPTTSSSSSSSSSSSINEIIQDLITTYQRRTPARTKLVDTFLGYLVIIGVLQFIYCLIGGGYPFNAFLSGFSATVGQLVLTVSLRMQSDVENQKSQFTSFSNERAFADYIFSSLLLHFLVINFIN